MKMDLDTKKHVLLNMEDLTISDMAVLNDSRLFLEKQEGLKSIQKSGDVQAAQEVSTSGLDCSPYWSIDVIEGRCLMFSIEAPTILCIIKK